MDLSRRVCLPPAFPAGESNMSRSITLRLLPCLMIVALFAGCTRDPNVRKQKYFDSGDKYFAQGKYREAIIQYSNAIQIDPRFAQAHYQLSQAYLKLGDSQRAYPELSRTVELAPDNYRARTDLANLLVTVRNPDGSPAQDALGKAKVQLDELRAKRPNAPETHEAWANYYAAQNNLGTAIQEINAGIMADPGRSESYLLLALLQLRSNQPNEAKKNFQKATQVDPKAMNAQLALGGFYQSHNQLPEAEHQFHNAISIDPKNPAPRAALVRLLMQEGKKDEIESFLRQTKKDLSDSPEGYRMLGDYYFAIGDLDKAVAEYGSLYSDHPKDPQVRKNYVQLLILKNRLDEASKLDNEILKTSPHDVDALVYKGQIQLHQNDAAGAVQSLQSALKNDSNSAVAHYQLGLAYAQQRDLHRAESEWREAVRIKPDMTEAHRLIASLEISRGEVDAVTQTAEQIIQAQPYSPDGFLIRSLAELARQKYAAAEKDAEEARNRAPESFAPYFQLGGIQLSQQHFPEAEKFYQQALD